MSPSKQGTHYGPQNGGIVKLWFFSRSWSDHTALIKVLENYGLLYALTKERGEGREVACAAADAEGRHAN